MSKGGGTTAVFYANSTICTGRNGGLGDLIFMLRTEKLVRQKSISGSLVREKGGL